MVKIRYWLLSLFGLCPLLATSTRPEGQEGPKDKKYGSGKILVFSGDDGGGCAQKGKDWKNNINVSAMLVPLSALCDLIWRGDANKKKQKKTQQSAI